MPKSNSEKFLDTFSAIETQLRKISGNIEYIPFANQVNDLAKSNHLLRRFKDDLLQFAELRNAIVHNRAEKVYAIAEPHDSTVSQLEKVHDKLTSPKLIYPEFQKDVHTFKLTESLSEVLKVIHEKRYSQFPVYDNEEKFFGVVTENGITNWLAGNVADEIVSLEETTIEEVLSFQEGQPYTFIARDKTIYCAEELFKDAATKGEELDAVLITHSGKKTEELLGVITVWDMVDVE